MIINVMTTPVQKMYLNRLNYHLTFLQTHVYLSSFVRRSIHRMVVFEIPNVFAISNIRRCADYGYTWFGMYGMIFCIVQQDYLEHVSLVFQFVQRSGTHTEILINLIDRIVDWSFNTDLIVLGLKEINDFNFILMLYPPGIYSPISKS
jgi:hypothetical protein